MDNLNSDIEKEKLKEKRKEKMRKIEDKVTDFIIIFGAIFLIGIFIYDKNRYDITYYFNKLIGKSYEEVKLEKKNDYYRDYDFIYAKNTDNFFASNKQELLDIFYTFLNSGEEKFTFHCNNKKYKNCTKDVHNFIHGKSKKKIMNYIYGYNHPYNDFSSISSIIDYDTGEVTYKIEKKYKKEDIEVIDAKVDELYEELVDTNDTDYNNIKRIHDYLVNNVEYDDTKRDFINDKSKPDSDFKSSSAYGALLQGKAICSGYTDAMALFLERMHIKNYRVLTEKHIWNAVLLDGKWYHIDVTWDRGKYTNGEYFLKHKYFLVDTTTLLENDTKEHNFDQNFYLELKEN